MKWVAGLILIFITSCAVEDETKYAPPTDTSTQHDMVEVEPIDVQDQNSTPDLIDTPDIPIECSEIREALRTAVEQNSSCESDDDCTFAVADSLDCHCGEYISVRKDKSDYIYNLYRQAVECNVPLDGILKRADCDAIGAFSVCLQGACGYRSGPDSCLTEPPLDLDEY